MGKSTLSAPHPSRRPLRGLLRMRLSCSASTNPQRIERPHSGVADIFAIPDEDSDRRHVGVRKIVAQPFQRNPPQSAARGSHHGHVLGVSAEIEVIGIAAAPLVAAMADLQAFGDRSVPGDPGQPMGHPALATKGELAVAVGLGRPLPDMAAREGIDLGEPAEPLGGRPGAGATPLGVLDTRTLVHARIIFEVPLSLLFWSLEVHRMNSKRWRL